ncbi:cephalosporin hydroxylase [archaeon]|nr:cephalosporin hydroxylase [archaeon]
MGFVNRAKNVATKTKNYFVHDKELIDAFNKQYFDTRVWQNRTHWFGTRILKCPTDLWVYQEMFHELQPDLVIETGTFNGGSALYMAHLMDIVGKGEIITIDIEKKDVFPEHPRITYHTASSVAPETIAMVAEKVRGKKSVMVILDSDHSRDHVLQEMKLYHRFVSKGNYLIVEDSNLNGNPIHSELRHGPGPMEALHEFLQENSDFKIDKDREKFMVTFNPNGYLKRVQ